jgi:hypothetical protein
MNRLFVIDLLYSRDDPPDPKAASREAAIMTRGPRRSRPYIVCSPQRLHECRRQRVGTNTRGCMADEPATTKIPPSDTPRWARPSRYDRPVVRRQHAHGVPVSRLDAPPGDAASGRAVPVCRLGARPTAAREPTRASGQITNALMQAAAPRQGDGNEALAGKLAPRAPVWKAGPERFP